MAREGVRPGPGGPKVVKVMIHLTERQRDALRRSADSRNLSMSEVVRQMVEDLILGEDDDE